MDYEEIQAIKEYVDLAILDILEKTKPILYPDEGLSMNEYLPILHEGQGMIAITIINLRVKSWELAKMRDSIELLTESAIRAAWDKVDNLKNEIDKFIMALLNTSKVISEREDFLDLLFDARED